MNERVQAGYQRIGQLFVMFSRLETALNKALLEALRLSESPAARLLVDIPIMRRIELFEAAVDGTAHRHGPKTSEEWRANAKRVAKQIKRSNDLRIQFAHGRLAVQETGSVVALWKKLEPEWDDARFGREFAQIDMATDALVGMHMELHLDVKGIDSVLETGMFSIEFPKMLKDYAARPGEFKLTGQPASRENSSDPSQTD